MAPVASPVSAWINSLSQIASQPRYRSRAGGPGREEASQPDDRIVISAAAGEPWSEGAAGGDERRWQRPRQSRCREALIPTEDFVAPVPSQYDGDISPRCGADQVSRDRRRIAEWAVVEPEQAIKKCGCVHVDGELFVACPERVRYFPRMRAFIVRRFFGEPDRERADGIVLGMSLHQRHDYRGIDASREQRAEWYVANQSSTGGILNISLDAFD